MFLAWSHWQCGLFLWIVSLLHASAAAQTIHTVQVGLEGSFFNPPTISAQVNDTITFVFSGSSHSVVQSTFAEPCSPREGGFSSGVSSRGNVTTGQPVPTWDLKITNASQPIWFFCSLTRPASHCAAGMVGVINPPSIDAYTTFLASAKAVVGTPSPRPTVVRLTGIGAFATAAPALSSTPVPASSTSATLTSTTSSTESIEPASFPSPSDESVVAADLPPTKKTNKAAIIGGSVAGAVVLLLVIGLLLFSRLRNKHRKDDATLKDFFQYRVPIPVPIPATRARAVMEETSPRALIAAGILPHDQYRSNRNGPSTGARAMAIASTSSEGEASHLASQTGSQTASTSGQPSQNYHSDSKTPPDIDSGMGYGAGAGLRHRPSDTQLAVHIPGHAYANATPVTASFGHSRLPTPSAITVQPPTPGPPGAGQYTITSLAQEVAAVLRSQPETNPHTKAAEPESPTDPHLDLVDRFPRVKDRERDRDSNGSAPPMYSHSGDP